MSLNCCYIEVWSKKKFTKGSLLVSFPSKKALWMKIENFARLLWTKNEFLHKPDFFSKDFQKRIKLKFLEMKSQGVFPKEIREVIISHRIFQILLYCLNLNLPRPYQDLLKWIGNNFPQHYKALKTKLEISAHQRGSQCLASWRIIQMKLATFFLKLKKWIYRLSVRMCIVMVV